MSPHKLIPLALIFCTIFFVTGQANAEFYTAAELVSFMREDERFDRGDRAADLMDASRYHGYVAGIYDVHVGVSVCPPKGVTIRIATAVVTKYLNEHPEQWTQTAESMVTRALKAAFPCVKR